jgi:RNA polymerase sigma factor (sigma-70 family)
VKIHKSKHLYNETLPFLPWLFTITKNALIDEVRKGEKEKNHLSVDAVTLISPEAEATPQLSEVLPYLKTLPENQKRVVEMRYIEEKTFEEISLALETSQMNVRKLLSRGVQRLKELLKEGDEP